jgi:hypothetical protein
MRIKVSDDAKGQGQVTLTAPAQAMSAADWQQKTTRLLDTILVQLGKRRGLGGAQKPAAASPRQH